MSAPRNAPTLDRTPALAGRLTQLGNSLTRQVWLYGLGTTLAIVCCWLVFAFFADFALRVPHAVRWLHLIVLVALPVWAIWRFLVRPLRRRPDAAGLAILIEREHPELKELLVSAVQFQESGEPEGDPELVQRVFATAEQRVSQITFDDVLEVRRPRQRILAGGAALGVVSVLALSQPGYAAIFFNRLFGGSASWPQRTHLVLDIPLLPENATIERTANRIDVRIARGTDVPVVVEVEGRVPREVKLHLEGAANLVLSPSSDQVFRTVLRSVQDDMQFYVTGGDDTDGAPRVSIVALEPPDVAGLAITVTPPAYTGRAPRTEFDRDVEVLVGSELGIVMQPSPPNAFGKARVLPADRLIDLEPRPFPPRDDESPPGSGLAFDWVANESVRFRFELESDSGLSNPDPGLFGIQVVRDRAPEVQLLTPGRAEIDVVVGGALPLRARASDDFGVQSMAWTVRYASEEDIDARENVLEFRTAEGDGPKVAVLGGRRLAVSELPPAGEMAREGEQFYLRVLARDNRPTPAEEEGASSDDRTGYSGSVRVRVVSTEEFLRRVQDRLARLRITTTALEELQHQKARRTEELIAAMESDSPEVSANERDLNALVSGQRRAQGDADALVKELAAVAETVLYAQLDEPASGALDQLDLALADLETRSFPTEVWRELADTWGGDRLGREVLGGRLLDFLGLALTISQDDSRVALEALERAGRELEIADVHAALLDASEHQARAITHIEELLERLVEWDNFQSILSLNRDLVRRQKALLERTKQALQER